VKNILLVLFIVFFSSCDSTSEKKGDIIPPFNVLEHPVNAQKSIQFLSTLIESDASSNLYFLRAKEYLKVRDYLKAQKDILRALKGGATDTDYVFLSAEIHYHLEMYDLALEDLKLIANTNQDIVAINVLFVQIYLAKNDLRKAKYHFQKLKTLGFEVGQPLVYQLMDQMILNESMNWINDLSMIRQISDQHNFVQQLYFQHTFSFKKAEIYQNELLSTMKKYPSDPHLMRFWAKFLSSMNKVDRAEKVYLQVQNLLPNNSNLTFELGDFYFKSRNYPKALSYYAQIPKTESIFAKALLMKAICLTYVGRRMESLSALDSVRKSYSTDIQVSQLFKRYRNSLYLTSANSSDSTNKIKVEN
jgi:tetratricopeptide (TPR) repeat protein